MAKFPLAWHEQNCRALIASTLRFEAEVLCMNIKLDKMRADADFYARQIEAAQRRGLDGFDPERFLHQRPAKVG